MQLQPITSGTPHEIIASCIMEKYDQQLVLLRIPYIKESALKIFP